jgi:hypothetical protein
MAFTEDKMKTLPTSRDDYPRYVMEQLFIDVSFSHSHQGPLKGARP